jgi:alpha-tubulin suppressor-like RCC1 family protein
VNGVVYVWGVNENGELGVGKGNEISTPKRLDLNFKVSFVSCGYYHSAVISSKFTFIFGWCWEKNSNLVHNLSLFYFIIYFV